MSLATIYPRHHVCRNKAAQLLRAVRARRPRGGTPFDRRDWNLHALFAAYNFIARMHMRDKAGR